MWSDVILNLGQTLWDNQRIVLSKILTLQKFRNKS